MLNMYLVENDFVFECATLVKVNMLFMNQFLFFCMDYFPTIV